MCLYLLPNISSSLLLITLTIFLFHVPYSLSVDDERYLNCSQSFECASIGSIGYPFWGSNRPDYCGFPEFKLNCSGDAPSILIHEQEFRVLSVNQSQSRFTVARADYWNTVCPVSRTNTTTIDNSSSRVLEFASDVQQLLLFYSCPPLNIPLPLQLTSQFNCSDSINYYVTKDLDIFGLSNISSTFGTCRTAVSVQVSQSAASNLALNASKENLGAALDSGFNLAWDASNTLCKQCQGSGGQCGYNTPSSEFTCYCKDGPNPSDCREDLTDFGISDISSTFGKCTTAVTVRLSPSAASNLAVNSSKENLGAALDSGYGLKWDASNNLCERCQGSGGRCGYNISSLEFSCYALKGWT